MKQKDIALIIVIVGASALFSFLIFNLLFGSKTNAKMQVEVIDPISANFQLPNDKYFNENSVNLTQIITIAPDQNQDPFNR